MPFHCGEQNKGIQLIQLNAWKPMAIDEQHLFETDSNVPNCTSSSASNSTSASSVPVSQLYGQTYDMIYDSSSVVHSYAVGSVLDISSANNVCVISGN